MKIAFVGTHVYENQHHCKVNSTKADRCSSVGSLGLTVVLLILCCFVSVPTIAAPVVVGSDYRVRLLEQSPSSLTVDATATFDGVAETFAISPTGTATIVESQANLGGGLWQIDINITSDADLFGNGGTTAGLMNIGGGNPLDLSGAFTTVSNTLVFTALSGATGTGSFPIFNNKLWDGTWITAGAFGGFGNAAAFDIRQIDLTLVVSTVPIPAAAPLFASALGLMGFMGWRKRQQAAG